MMEDDGRCLVSISWVDVPELDKYNEAGPMVFRCCACFCVTNGYIHKHPICRQCYTILVQRMEKINRADFREKTKIFRQREILLAGRHDRSLCEYRGHCAWCGGFFRSVTSYYHGANLSYNLCTNCESMPDWLISTVECREHDKIYNVVIILHRAGFLWDIAKIIGGFCWMLTDVRRLAADSLL